MTEGLTGKAIRKCREATCLAVLGPFVLTADLILLLGGEVVLDVEGLTDLLRRLALDHVRDSLAADVEERLNVQVVGSQDNLEQHLLVNLHKLLVPLIDVGGLAAIVVVIGSSLGVILVVLAPLNDLLEDGLVNVRNGNSLARIAEVLQHVLDQNGALSNDAVDGDVDTIAAGQGDLSGHFEGGDVTMAELRQGR